MAVASPTAQTTGTIMTLATIAIAEAVSIGSKCKECAMVPMEIDRKSQAGANAAATSVVMIAEFAGRSPGLRLGLFAITV